MAIKQYLYLKEKFIYEIKYFIYNNYSYKIRFPEKYILIKDNISNNI